VLSIEMDINVFSQYEFFFHPADSQTEYLLVNMDAASSTRRTRRAISGISPRKLLALASGRRGCGGGDRLSGENGVKKARDRIAPSSLRTGFCTASFPRRSSTSRTWAAIT
jgi:hypothetical protein